MDDQAESGTESGEPPGRRTALIAAVILLISGSHATAGDAHPPDPPYVKLELKMFGLVNGDRQKHKKRPLKYDNALAAVARAHSADMLEHRFFHHKSQRTGMVADRLFAAKETVMESGENIAMHDSIEQAEARLMESPGHRKNILKEDFTHCGVGIVEAANGIYYVTQVFAARPPPVDFKTLEADVVTVLNKVRAIRGKLPYRISPALTKVAAGYVAEVARAGKPVAVDVGARVRAAGVEAKRLSAGLVSTWDPGELASAAALMKPRKGRIGIAFARNEKHKSLGYGIIWVYAIFTDE